MPSVNMIAPRRAERMRLERDMRRLLVVIMAEIVLAVGLGGWTCTKLLTTRNRTSELKLQLARLQPVVKQIEGYEKATKKLMPKLELLNAAKDRTMTWCSILDRLTQSLPQSTYLTRVSTEQSNKKNGGAKVTLNGVSISQSKIGETMMRLQNIPDFKEVDLHFTQPTVVRKASAIEFEIGAVIKGAPSPKGARSNAVNQS